MTPNIDQSKEVVEYIGTVPMYNIGYAFMTLQDIAEILNKQNIIEFENKKAQKLYEEHKESVRYMVTDLEDAVFQVYVIRPLTQKEVSNYEERQKFMAMSEEEKLKYRTKQEIKTLKADINNKKQALNRLVKKLEVDSNDK